MDRRHAPSVEPTARQLKSDDGSSGWTFRGAFCSAARGVGKRSPHMARHPVDTCRKRRNPRGRDPGGPTGYTRGDGWLQYAQEHSHGQAGDANVTRRSQFQRIPASWCRAYADGLTAKATSAARSSAKLERPKGSATASVRDGASRRAAASAGTRSLSPLTRTSASKAPSKADSTNWMPSATSVSRRKTQRAPSTHRLQRRPRVRSLAPTYARGGRATARTSVNARARSLSCCATARSPATWAPRARARGSLTCWATSARSRA